MKRTITFLLTLALLVLPLRAGKADTNDTDTVEAQWWVLCVAAVAVVVIGTAAYVVHKCDQSAKDREKCETCQNPNRKDANFCANCGVAVRCEDCDTRLPKGATKCPTCETKVPAPQKPLTQVQMSTDGLTWTSVLSGTKVESLVAVTFKSEAEFEAWAYREDTLQITRLPMERQAFFRLKSDD